MKSLLAILGVSMGIVFAVPAHAEPGIDEPPGRRKQRLFPR